MSLEAILDSKGTRNKQKKYHPGSPGTPNKTKRSKRPLLHASPDTRALSHTGAEWAGGVTPWRIEFLGAD